MIIYKQSFPIILVMKLIIYEIRHNNIPDQFYIGSTNNFSSRKSKHKKNVFNRVGKLYWSKLYLFIRQNGGWCNVTMKKIFEDVCETKDVIRQKEQYYIDLFKPTLNSCKACII